MNMTIEELRKILEDHRLWLNNEGGRRAQLQEADLRSAQLQGAQLQGAQLQGAQLQGADLRSAQLQEADLRSAQLRSAQLQGAQLQGAQLQEADLRSAQLQEAQLQGANLRSAQLQGANLDYTCLPLRCGGLCWKIDRRIAAQIAYHLCSMECDDPDFISARNALLPFANTFHRKDECGELLPILRTVG
jgi:uncharacterized protein YjbI with pentapeptide repeats